VSIDWQRVRAVMGKDVREAFTNAQIVGPLVVVPLVVVIGYPVIYLLALRLTPGAATGLGGFIGDFPRSAVPAFALADSVRRAAYVGVVYLFAGFFLLVPVMVSTVIAANSFAGEKERRTLEGLLYTPVSDGELVVAKIGAAFVPAVAFTWLCFAIYTAIIAVFATPIMGRIFFPTGNWWALMLLLVPATSLLVISIVVMVSAKARGFQEANAIGGAIVLPLVGVVAAEASGLMVLSTGVIVLAAGVFAVLDILLLRVIIRTFHRSRVVSYLS
jgi:ABC-2 type transport system permease protein